MSANKFKVGDKVKVRKGLVADKYYDDVSCDSSMAKMGGRVLTINCVKSSHYEVEENTFYWTDEMLEPAEKTLDNLCVGDFVGCRDHLVRKVLIVLGGCYLLSYAGDHDAAGDWYTATQLDEFGCYPIQPDASEPTIEIDGKKYKKADVEKAIKDLEPID